MKTRTVSVLMLVLMAGVIIIFNRPVTNGHVPFLSRFFGDDQNEYRYTLLVNYTPANAHVLIEYEVNGEPAEVAWTGGRWVKTFHEVHPGMRVRVQVTRRWPEFKRSWKEANQLECAILDHGGAIVSQNRSADMPWVMCTTFAR